MKLSVQRIRTSVAVGFMLSTLSGCWAAQEKRTLAHLDKYLPRLQKGATLAEVEQAFDSKATHEFTITHDHKFYVCASVSSDGCSAWYAVLNEGKLEKIVEPPSRRAEEVRIDGAKVLRTLPWRSEDEAERVMSAKDLCGPTLLESVRKRFPYLRNSNLAGGEYILGPILFFGNLADRPEMRRQQALAQRFSGFKISRGMSNDEVEAIFGKPFRRMKNDNNEIIEVFGHNPAASAMFPEASPWVAVVFREGCVDHVFSHNFFNKQIYLSDQKTLALNYCPTN